MEAEDGTIKMEPKQIATIFLLSLALMALLGCVEEPGPGGTECVGEGQTVPVIASPPECCPGLTLIPPKESQIVGIMGYCTANCGNGSCDSIESSLNCPQDCKTVEGCDPSACGNGQCNYGLSETCLNCADCFGLCGCGDGVCTAPDETQATCPWDC